MAVLKFSQISTTGSNLASSDFLLAVQGGTADVLFTPAQVFAFANLVYASNILEQRNLANAQSFRVYNTTDAPGSNYERGVFDWTTTANVLTIGTQKLGTGQTRVVNFEIGGILAVQLTNNGFNLQSGRSIVSGGTGFDATNVYCATLSLGTGFATDTNLSRGAAGIIQFASSQSFSADGTVATVLGSLGPTGASTTVQEWLTIKNASGTTRYIPCF